MNRRFHGRFLRRAMIAAVVCASFPSCYSWHVRSWDQQRRAAPAETLRLTLEDGARVVIAGGVAVGDSVVGTSVGQAAGGRLAIGAGDIRDIGFRQLDIAKTVFLAAGFGTAGVALFGVLSATTCGAGGGASC